jgi:hypothetical protein
MMNGSPASPSRALLCLAILALCLVSPARVALYGWSEEALVAMPWPADLRRGVLSSSADLDGDGQAEQVVLQDHRAYILGHEETLWSSPEEWRVEEALITDLNADQTPEVSLLLWRAFAPWPIDSYLVHPGRIDSFHNRKGQSCHLILIGYRDGHFIEVWAGSALADPLLQIAALDLDGDGRQELVALESHYNQLLPIGEALTIWEWNGFGFTLRWRGLSGRLAEMQAISGFRGSDLLLIQGTLRR